MGRNYQPQLVFFWTIISMNVKLMETKKMQTTLENSRPRFHHMFFCMEHFPPKKVGGWGKHNANEFRCQHAGVIVWTLRRSYLMGNLRNCTALHYTIIMLQIKALVNDDEAHHYRSYKAFLRNDEVQHRPLQQRPAISFGEGKKAPKKSSQMVVHNGDLPLSVKKVTPANPPKRKKNIQAT